MRGMYPHTATVWRKGPEEDVRATWSRLAPVRCRIEGPSAVVRAISGDTNADSLVFIIRHTDGLVIAPGDKASRGDVPAATPPPGAHTITAAEPLSVGTADIHHWEVTAR